MKLLTQKDFERHIQAMWPVTRAKIEIDFSIAALLGYSFAWFGSGENHADLLFLVNTLIEMEKMA